MRRNNKDSQAYRKPSGKGGNFNSSSREERPEREQRPSPGRFFQKKNEGSAGSRRSSPGNASTDRDKNPFRKPHSGSERYGSRTGKGNRQEDKGTFKKFGFDKRQRSESGSKSPYKKSGYGKSGVDRGRQSESSVKNFTGVRAEREEGVPYKTVYKGRGRDQKPRYETVKREESEQKTPGKKFFSKTRATGNGPSEPKPTYDFKKFEKRDPHKAVEAEIRLNKYIANSGICSRREADALIENGLISVNGNVVRELGHKVLKKDNVEYQGKRLNPEKPVYVLLNKPKDFITTTDDPMERKTVMSLVSGACDERIFPVGRLDRNTTGLLLFTNDGDLADKLASPANNIKKIYQVTLDTPITKKDVEAILEGVTLEDGPVKVDDLQVLSKDRTILGLEIHIGKNRIVRRIFAHFGYEVVSLDRVVYAGLTKKDLARGNYRFLGEKEVINLKYFT